MFVRTLMALATLGGGVLLGSWFLSFPSNDHFSSADTVPVVADAPRPNAPLSADVEIKQGALQPAAATIETAIPAAESTYPKSHASAPAVPVPDAQRSPAVDLQADAGAEANDLVSEPDVQPMSEAMGGGRMSLGASPESGSAEPSVPTRRRSLTREQKLFVHPLGQL